MDIETIEDLKEHPRYGDDACQLVDIVDEGDFSRITEYVSNRYPKSHPSCTLFIMFLTQ